MRRILLAMLVVGMLTAGCMGAKQATPEAPPTAAEMRPAPVQGHRAPEITGKDVRTGDVVLLSQFKGKVVLVNFWATWCPPCREEMPDLETLQTEMGDRLKVLSVGGDAAESADKLLGYANDQKLSFTVLFDRGTAVLDYRVIALPTSYLIDQNGIVQAKVQGAMNLDQMRQVVAETESAGKQPQ